MKFVQFNLSLLHIISFLFRLVISAFAIYILYSNLNYFTHYWYITFGIVYWIIFLLCFYKSSKTKSRIRFINDYLFIMLILYGKDYLKLDNFFFLLLPILNSYNHSYVKSTGFTLFLYVFPICFLLFGTNINFFEIIIPFITLYIINTFFSIRKLSYDIYDAFNDMAEKFQLNETQIGKTYKLLQNFIKIHKKESWLNTISSIENMICFKIEDNKLFLVNSNKIIVNWRIENEQNFINELHEKKYIKDIKVEIDDWNIGYNMVYRIKHNVNTYCFLMTYEKKPINFLYSIYCNKILFPVLNKISKIITTEFELAKRRRVLYDQIKNRLEYIDISTSAIHLLNNKLELTSLYYQLSEELKTLEVSTEKYNEIEALKEQVFKDAKYNFDIAMKRIQKVMENEFNPYSTNNFESKKLNELFIFIRNSIQLQSVKEINLRINYKWQDISNITTKINLPFFEFIIEEIILNVNKYAKSQLTVEFSKDENGYFIMFSNDMKTLDQSGLISLNKIITEFNSQNMSEILRRGVRGTRILKQYLIQLNFEHKIELTDTYNIKIWIKHEKDSNF